MMFRNTEKACTSEYILHVVQVQRMPGGKNHVNKVFWFFGAKICCHIKETLLSIDYGIIGVLPLF